MSELKRDENGRIIRDEAEAETQRLMKKLIQTEREHQKDISFNHARGNKRDIMVYVTIFARNSVDGNIVLGDEGKGFAPLDSSGRDPYKYKDLDFIEFPIMSREMPLAKIAMGQAIKGLFTALAARLMKIGAIDR